MRPSVAFEVAQYHALGGFGSLVTDMLDSAVGAIRIESTYGPPVYIPDPFSPAAQAAAAGGPAPVVVPGQGFDVARMLKPKVTFEMRSGDPVVYAPYGDPGASHWGVVLAIGLGIVLLAGYGGVSLAKKARR